MRSLRRNAMLVLLFALLGAATTVAVAWGFALRGSPPPSTTLSSTPFPKSIAVPFVATTENGNSSALILSPGVWSHGFISLDVRPWPYAGATTDAFREQQRQMIDWSGSSLLARVSGRLSSAHVPNPKADSRHGYWFGWPLWCMWSAEDTSLNGGRFSSLGWISTLVLQSPVPKNVFTENPYLRTESLAVVRRTLAVPTGILPRGFALNTAFYAVLWWALALGIARGRAWNRRRRGLCARCAYSREGLDAITPCPECGMRLPRHKARHA